MVGMLWGPALLALFITVRNQPGQNEDEYNTQDSHQGPGVPPVGVRVNCKKASKYIKVFHTAVKCLTFLFYEIPERAAVPPHSRGRDGRYKEIYLRKPMPFLVGHSYVWRALDPTARCDASGSLEPRPPHENHKETTRGAFSLRLFACLQQT